MKWIVVVAALVACGPSSAEVKTAKLAHYSARAETLLDVALEVAQRDYKIAERDREHGRFITEGQVYGKEGDRHSAGAGGFVSMGGGDVVLSLLVEIVPATPGVVVVVTPHTLQVVAGSPKPRELAPDDPSLPPWVNGRVDALAVAIYDAAKQHAMAP